MATGEYSFLRFSMIEECRSYACFLCSKEDHTLQYVVLKNEVGLSSLNPGYLIFACSLKIKAVCIEIINLILLMLLFSFPERFVNTSSTYSS
jgi:hypothetical protein